MELEIEGQNESVIDSKETENIKVEILQFDELQGAKHPSVAQELYYARQIGLTMKRVKFTLEDASISIEPDALHYMKGDLELSSGTQEGGFLGLGKALWRRMTVGETVFKTTIEGTGEVYLEPSFGHFLLQELDDEEVIADQGIFAAGGGDIEVYSERIAKISAMLFGGEGWFQTKVSGTGLVVFNCPVPLSEVVRVDLEDEKLSVDGSFAILRTGELAFVAETSSKSWIGSLTSGEGLLQTFEGTGSVWLAPTNSYYQGIEEQRVRRLEAQMAMREAQTELVSQVSSIKSSTKKIAGEEEEENEEEEPE